MVIFHSYVKLPEGNNNSNNNNNGIHPRSQMCLGLFGKYPFLVWSKFKFLMVTIHLFGGQNPIASDQIHCSKWVPELWWNLQLKHQNLIFVVPESKKHLTVKLKLGPLRTISPTIIHSDIGQRPAPETSKSHEIPIRKWTYLYEIPIRISKSTTN